MSRPRKQLDASMLPTGGWFDARPQVAPAAPGRAPGEGADPGAASRGLCAAHGGEDAALGEGTAGARQVLKKEIALQDAIFNCGRVAVLVAAFATGNMEWLRHGTEDALHQQQRAPIHPHLKPLIKAALDAGAHGALGEPSVVDLPGTRKLFLLNKFRS
eukprot:s332_g2.t1